MNISEQDSINFTVNNPYRFAKLKAISIPTNIPSDWSVLDDNQVWQHRVQTEEALSLSAVFNDLDMPDGAEFYVFCIETGWITGPITNKNFPVGAGKISSEVLKGSSVNFFYREPIGGVGLRNIAISEIGYGYRAGASEYQGLNDIEGSSSCNVDVTHNPKGNCFSMEKRAEAMVLINLNTEECSGTLLTNSEFFSSPRPYFLLGDHCIVTGSAIATSGLVNLNNLSLRFKYWTNSNNFVTYTGVKLRAENSSMDMALIELNTPIRPNDEIFFAGWDRTGTIPTSISTAHHPAGDRTKISFDGAPPIINTAAFFPGIFAQIGTIGPGFLWEYNLNQPSAPQNDFGTIEGGSSGGPLYDPSHLVIGHNVGFRGNGKACPPVDNRVGGRFSAYWGNTMLPQFWLAKWLAPSKGEPTSLIGNFFIKGADKVGCKDLVLSQSAPIVRTNSTSSSSSLYSYTWTLSPNLTIVGSTTGSTINYKAISNKPVGTTEWIECLLRAPSSCGTIQYKARKIITWSNGGANLELRLPNGELSSTSLCVSTSHTFFLTTADGNPLPVGPTYSWTISGGSGASISVGNQGKTLSLFTGYGVNQSISLTVTIVGGVGECFSGSRTFYFFAKNCGSGGWIVKPPNDGSNVNFENSAPTIWPNPSTGETFFSIPNTWNLESATIELLDVSGKTLWRSKQLNQAGKIPTEGMLPGIYFLKISDRSQDNVQKLIIH